MTRTCARPGCGREFQPKDCRSLYCSKECGQKAYRARHVERINELQRGYYARYKAAHPKQPRKRSMRSRETRRERIQEVRYAPYIEALLEARYD